MQMASYTSGTGRRPNSTQSSKPTKRCASHVYGIHMKPLKSSLQDGTDSLNTGTENTTEPHLRIVCGVFMEGPSS